MLRLRVGVPLILRRRTRWPIETAENMIGRVLSSCRSTSYPHVALCPFVISLERSRPLSSSSSSSEFDQSFIKDDHLHSCKAINHCQVDNNYNHDHDQDKVQLDRHWALVHQVEKKSAGSWFVSSRRGPDPDRSFSQPSRQFPQPRFVSSSVSRNKEDSSTSSDEGADGSSSGLQKTDSFWRTWIEKKLKESRSPPSSSSSSSSSSVMSLLSSQTAQTSKHPSSSSGGSSNERVATTSSSSRTSEDLDRDQTAATANCRPLPGSESGSGQAEAQENYGHRSNPSAYVGDGQGQEEAGGGGGGGESTFASAALSAAATEVDVGDGRLGWRGRSVQDEGRGRSMGSLNGEGDLADGRLGFDARILAARENAGARLAPDRGDLSLSYSRRARFDDDDNRNVTSRSPRPIGRRNRLFGRSLGDHEDDDEDEDDEEDSMSGDFLGRPRDLELMDLDEQNAATMGAVPREMFDLGDETRPYSLRTDRKFFPGQMYEPEDVDVSTPPSHRPSFVTRERKRFTEKEVLAKADFRNLRFLQHFITETGRLIPRRNVKLRAKVQRKVVREIKTSRALGLMPFQILDGPPFRPPLRAHGHRNLDGED